VLSLGADLDRGYALVTPSAIVVDPVDGRRVSTYRFRHAAIQQYLLARLDLVELPHMHAAVGKALEEVHAGHVPDVATKLAFHFEQGGVVAKAVGYLDGVFNLGPKHEPFERHQHPARADEGGAVP